MSTTEEPETTATEHVYENGTQEQGGRRQSVAHNVIENPLKVSARGICALETVYSFDNSS